MPCDQTHLSFAGVLAFITRRLATADDTETLLRPPTPLARASAGIDPARPASWAP